ncbi:hypothetical protein L9F63_006061, partial [Diploptera punctata]
YKQRLGRLQTPVGTLLPPFLSDRLRKRRAFADRELEAVLPSSLLLQSPEDRSAQLLPLTLLPLVPPPALWLPPRITPVPDVSAPTSDNTPKNKPKISFSVESIIGVK